MKLTREMSLRRLITVSFAFTSSLVLLHGMVLPLKLKAMDDPSPQEQKGRVSFQRTLNANAFTTGRSLEDYHQYFIDESDYVKCGSDLVMAPRLGESHIDTNALYKVLSTLHPDDHIMDLGAGQVVAMGEYLGIDPLVAQYQGRSAITQLEGLVHGQTLEQKGKVTAVTFRFNRQSTLFQTGQGVEERAHRLDECPNFHLLEGRYFEDISPEEITGYHNWGNLKAIVDVWGAIAYSLDPSSVLRKALSMLREDGVILLVTGRPLNTVGFMENQRESSLYHGMVKIPVPGSYPDYKSFPSWLKTIPGIEVRDVNDQAVAIRITDRSSALRIPRLKFIGYDEDEFRGPQVPPARRFEQE